MTSDSTFSVTASKTVYQGKRIKISLKVCHEITDKRISRLMLVLSKLAYKSQRCHAFHALEFSYTTHSKSLPISKTGMRNVPYAPGETAPQRGPFRRG